jgi:hypothetical protein
MTEVGEKQKAEGRSRREAREKRAKEEEETLLVPFFIYLFRVF